MFGRVIAELSFAPMSLFMLTDLNRREILTRSGCGLGAVALSALLATESSAAEQPLAVREPHIPARAKRVIFLFMPGGPSQVDTFDPKPQLTKRNGEDSPKLYLGQQRKLLASPWKFCKHGKCGLEVSELFPHTANCVDDLCVIRSMVSDDPNHRLGLAKRWYAGNRITQRSGMVGKGYRWRSIGRSSHRFLGRVGGSVWSRDPWERNRCRHQIGTAAAIRRQW